MRTPTDLEREKLLNLLHNFGGVGGGATYDPVKAHEYYEKHKKLKGRKPGRGDDAPSGDRPSGQDPRAGKSRQQIATDARAKQRKEMAAAIKGLEDRLNKLMDLIKKREREEKSEDRKSKAKKERSAKERDKPKSAAEKAEAARDNEKYRDKHKQELKNKDKKGSGGGKKGKGSDKKHSVSELRSLATKVKGQIAVAKQKLAAL